MPGARGHRNEDGPRKAFGKLTISPQVKKQLNGSTMSRRTQIKQGMGVSGGTQAPNGRRKQITEALRGNGKPPPMRFPTFPRGGNPGVRVPGRGQPTGRPGAQGEKIGQGVPSMRPLKGAGPGVAGNMQPGLGKQLSNRVRSGAINQGQAQTVARQRAMLQKAFGSDWRKQVYGAGGAKGIGGPFAERQVAAKRSQGLARAKRKLY